jgi:MoaA/NifB/PqqE/SkfB family radical SAM enzyme
MTTATLQRPMRSIWVELTGKCQLECIHCYAGSSPEGTHGDMTAEDWEKVLDDARALGTGFVCFIGGEPTLNPDLPRLVRHALAIGMEAEVFSNLVAVSAATWELLKTPGVRLATSWYSDDREQHKAITERDTWRQTKANISKAVMLGIPLRAGVIDGLVPGQRYAEGIEMLKAMGVTDIGGDHLREFGRGTTCDPTQGCGNCGAGRAAILPDGSVTPCPLTRWMKAGNVHDAPLGDHIEEVRSQASVIPNWRGRAEQDQKLPDRCWPERELCWPSTKPCYPRPPAAAETLPGYRPPGEVTACGPDCGPACWPFLNCGPFRSASATEVTACGPDHCSPQSCNPECVPTCSPTCGPYLNCGPVASAEVDGKCFPDACGPDVPCKPGLSAETAVCPPDACYPDTHEDCSPYDCKPVKTTRTAVIPETADCMPICAPMCRPSTCKPSRADAEMGVCEPHCPPSTGPCRPQNESCRPDGMSCRPDDRAVTDACRPDNVCGPFHNCRPVHAVTDACRPDNVCGPAYCSPGNSAPVEVAARKMPGCMPDPCRPYPDCEPYRSCRPEWGQQTAEVSVEMPDCIPDWNPCRPHSACGPDGCGPTTAEVTAVATCGPDACAPDYICGPCGPDYCGPGKSPALVLAGGPDPCSPDSACEPDDHDTTCKPDFVCGPDLVCGPHGMR